MKSHPSFTFRVAVCAAIAFCGGLATAYSATNTTRQDKVIVRDGVSTTVPAIKRADRDFLEKAAKAGMEEVEISQVAAQRTTSPDVRRLAQMIIDDHAGA